MELVAARNIQTAGCICINKLEYELFIKHLVTLLLLITLTAAAWAEPTQDLIDLPDIGGPESGVLSPAQERAISGQIAREIRKSLPVEGDPELNTYLSAVGDRLVSSSPDATGRMIFLLIDSPEINAFAAPGGVIAVNTGLIIAAKNESEMAGVMAHEIAHVTQRHLARTYANQSNMTLKTGLTLLAGLLLGAYNTDMGAAAVMSGLAASQQSRLKYSRSNEQEADRIGIQTLASAGYDPRGMPQFFQTLQKETGQSGDKLIEYLQTHPLTSSRITDSFIRAEQYTGHYEQDSTEFHYAQARIEALQRKPKDIINDYQQARSAFKPKAVDEYKYALALTRNGNPEKALRILDGIPAGSRQLAVELAIAEALLKANRNEQAIKKLSRIYALYPTYNAINFLLAKSYVQNQQPKKAIQLLSYTLTSDDTTPAFYRLLAEAASLDHQKALSQEAMAEYYFANGQYSEAMAQITMALKDPDIDDIMKKRLESKRDILKTWLENGQ
jgi:beta-barrel assembly-enhancing protease